MSREQAYGALFVILGTTFLLVYLIAFFAVELTLPAWLHRIAVELPVLALVVVFFFVIIRIGWNMITAPPAKSLREQEIMEQEVQPSKHEEPDKK